MATNNLTAQQSYVKLIELRDHSGATIFERLKLADRLLSDREWVHLPEGGGGDESKAIDRLEDNAFGDIKYKNESDDIDFSDFLPIHDQKTQAFANYVSGFADGEGSFMLRVLREDTELPVILGAEFAIVLRADDADILYKIKKFFNCGVVNLHPGRKAANNVAHYRVGNSVDLVANIIPHFDRYPLRAKKLRDYELWKRGVEIIYTIRCRPGRKGKLYIPQRTNDEIVEFIRLRDSIREGRKYTQERTASNNPSISGALSLPEMLDILKGVPQLSQWKAMKFNLRKLHMEMKGRQKAKTHPTAPISPPREPRTIEEKYKAVQNEKQLLLREIADLKRENRRLRTAVSNLQQAMNNLQLT